MESVLVQNVIVWIDLGFSALTLRCPVYYRFSFVDRHAVNFSSCILPICPVAYSIFPTFPIPFMCMCSVFRVLCVCERCGLKVNDSIPRTRRRCASASLAK